MQDVKYNDYLKEATKILPSGAFLTVKSGNKVNTMTIGWGTIGFIWGKPIFMVAVRDSRYTFNLIEESDQFTVSIPFDRAMKEELIFCGTKSGRDYDKFKECNLTAVPGMKVDTPVIGGCKLHYECLIRFKQAMDPNKLAPSFDEKWYPENDYHTLYFGEIVASYIDEQV